MDLILKLCKWYLPWMKTTNTKIHTLKENLPNVSYMHLSHYYSLSRQMLAILLWKCNMLPLATHMNKPMGKPNN